MPKLAIRAPQSPDFPYNFNPLEFYFIFCKVRITKHQNPKFGPKLGEIFKECVKKYNNIHQRANQAPFFWW
jgi:hypothetical protein